MLGIIKHFFSWIFAREREVADLLEDINKRFSRRHMPGDYLKVPVKKGYFSASGKRKDRIRLP